MHDATTERDSLSSGRNFNVHAAGKDSYILSLPSLIRKDCGFGMIKTVERILVGSMLIIAAATALLIHMMHYKFGNKIESSRDYRTPLFGYHLQSKGPFRCVKSTKNFN